MAQRVSLVIISTQIFAASGSVRFTDPSSSFCKEPEAVFSCLPAAERTKFCMQGCQSAHPDHSSIRREDLPNPETFRLYYMTLHREVVVSSTNRNEGHVQVANITLKSYVRLGHSSVVITLDLYSRCISGVQEAAAAQFEAAMEAALVK